MTTSKMTFSSGSSVMIQLPRHQILRRRPVTTRRVQLLLAGLWILDGALQLQPFMFTRGFAEQVIAPAGQGQPGFVAVPVAWAAHLVAAQPVLLDVLFALAQLGLGAGLLWRRTVRLALAGSVLWSLGVWYLGEGLGGLAGGQASLLTGAPGAVLIYALLAVAAWPRPAGPESGTTVVEWLTGGRSDSPLPSWSLWAWAVLWIGDATLRLVPGQDGLAATIAGNAAGAPGWLSDIDRHVASGLHQLGAGAAIALYAIEVLIGLLPLLGRTGRTGRVAIVGLCLPLLAAMWIVGQSLGQLYSGQATDPNTAVPLAVLALGVLSAGTANPGRRPGLPRRADPRPDVTAADRLAA